MLLPATSAEAANTTKYVDSNCPYAGCSSGDLYLKYRSSGVPNSALATFYGNVYNYAGQTISYNGATAVDYVFVFGPGDGSGTSVKNNAASATNCADADNYRVYFNSGYTGTAQLFEHAGGCFVAENFIAALKNNNASQHFA
ncbi:hypothetical protein [Streptomyces liangshanensis]|uniref:Uncharacterized protein n=1 Tax=Streptomyces liangshanensis TaxID=2717324 RepID=A0A6G9GWP7_9ACTN|nr:hypothetical protein [Streptomyces liangshanensis]QIQ02634.1 hypothetical protein HA039_10170 [Streptomyces liangshanensis]